MGWCHEFGCQITSGCDHPMQAGATACTCSVCETVCKGRFSGCPEVWSRSTPVASPVSSDFSGLVTARPVTSTDRHQPQPQQSHPQQPAAARSGPQTGHGMATTQGSAAGTTPQPNLLSRQSGARILGWMRAEFDGVRSQLQALASGMAHQQALVSDMAASRGSELNGALAELEGSATQLRTEAARMRRDTTGLQEDGAELRNAATRLRDMERSLSERLPAVVAEAVRPELRAALREVEAITAGLRDEASQLRVMRDGLAQELPKLIEAAVRDALAAAPPVAAVPAVAAPAPVAPVAEPRAYGLAQQVAAPVIAGVDGVLADEPTDEPLPAFGAPPAAAPAAAGAADGGVGEDPLVCTLPGLVVGPSLALGISEALRRAGLRRRRRRRASEPAPGLHLRDPFASHVTRRLDRYARARASLAAVKPAGDGRGPGRSSTVAAGFRDAEELTLDLAAGAGLALAGPAAADVARALVTSFLAQNADGDGHAVVVGDLLPPVRAFPGLAQPPDLATALEQLTEELARRRAGDAGGRPPLPTTLLVARGASPDQLVELTKLLDDGAARGIVGVVVDAEPEGAVAVRLEAGERVGAVSDEALAARLVGARLYTLGREAAAELLAVLASARTDEEVVTRVTGGTEPFDVSIPASPGVSVQLLGGYRIEVGGTEIRAGLRAKARELLAFYLLHPDGTTLDAAVEALWPEADPGRGSEWFWTALGNLRSRLRDATGEKKLKVIEREGDRYRVEPLFDVDLWRLEQALADGAGGDGAGRTEAYDRVAQAYAGDLLDGADWAWSETPREDLRQRVLDVLVWLGDIRWSAGDARGAWQALQRAVEVDPYAEQIYRRIMRLQAKLSRPDDAAITFRRLQARLLEIDLEPTQESERLHQELCGTA